jgi:hypothetical protein
MLKIINTDSDFSIGHWLNLLDDSDIKRFSFMDIEKNNNFWLVLIEDVKYAGSPYYYYYFKVVEEEGFLKAPSHYRLVKNKKIPLDNYLDYMIDVKLFNRYIKEKQLSEKDMVVSTYMAILNNKDASGSNADFYRKISSFNDIAQLLSERPPYPNPFDDLIDIENINIDFHNGLYYWFYNEGIVRADFHFEEHGILKSVHFTYIGRLGNENLGI